ncbi:MAG TPA: GAF domain-containing sensor histidine kinase [Ktedonobacterales bacterium]
MELEQDGRDFSADQYPQNPAEMRLHGGWLLIARIGWIVLTLLILMLNAIAIPRTDALLQSVCQPGAPCLSYQVQPGDLRVLQQLGLSPAFNAAYQITWGMGTTLICSALAALIFWRQSSDRMALFCAYMLVLWGGATFSTLLDLGLRTLAPVWYWLIGGVDLLTQVSPLAFFLLFPSGRFVPRWTRWGLLVIVLLEVQFVFFTNEYIGQFSALNGLSFASLLFGLVGLQVYRYRRVSTFRERQQTKWVVFGLAVALGGFALLLLIGNLFPAVSANSSLGGNPISATAVDGLLLLLPISIAIAVLRSNLWDIDIIINRTLVYGALTASVVGGYILVVGYLGTLFRTGSNLLISLVATGIVAVLFQPLRGWLQRGVNRLLYGQRDEPYAVVAQLSRRLESILAPDAILPAIAETLANSLKLPYVAIALRQGEEFTIAATYGVPADGALTLPLSYQAEPIGKLVLGPRQRGETLTPADRSLLDDLARQVGPAIHAVRLTADLQRSRERLVTTREEERRRLRRDLHDGLGATLAALHLQAGAIRTLMGQDLPAADAELLELQAGIRSSISDIRRLVYALRPPTLDEFGLAGAIRQYAAQYDRPGELDGRLLIEVEAPAQLPGLPAAMEVAAYRVVQEALTNVVRHAQAHTCRIRLSRPDESSGVLLVEINDDGVGLPNEPHAGVGLLSMRERAEEVGGSCVIASAPEHGTHVQVRLPFPKE